MATDNVTAALEYAARGWMVFPVHYMTRDKICSCNKANCDRAGKHPATKNGLKDATNDPGTIRRLWSKPYFNVGLLTGIDNLVVLDIDTDAAKGKKGLDSIRALESVHGALPATLSQRTGSGGRHLFYRSANPIRNSASKLGPDLDIRGVGGYVILPPSNHASGGRYEWLNAEPIAALPEWIEAELTADTAKSGEIDPTADAPQTFSKKEVRVKLSLEDATTLLKWIDYEDRELWWTTGAAFKTEYGQPGYAAWDEWSQQSSKYSEPMQQRQWSSFKEGLYSAGTLFKYATDGGFRGFDEETADAPEYKENWIWVGTIKRFIELNTMLELDAESFDGKFAFDFKKGTPSKMMLKNEAFPRVDSVTYWPQQERLVTEDGISKLNLWRPSGVSPEAGNVNVMLDHIRYLYPEPAEHDTLLDYLAYQVQHPGKKVHWAILLQGLPGNGKSYFGHLMACVLGAHNVRQVSSEMMHDTFTEWQKNTQFVVVEEIMARGRMELMNKLKPLITQPTVNIQEKFKPTYEQKSRYNFLFLTNHSDALILDATDRRYCILASNFGPHPDGRVYYDRLFSWTSDNAASILGHLLARNLAGFAPHGHAPMTAGKREMIEESMPALDQWIRDKVDSGIWPFSGDIVNPSDIATVIREFNFHSNPKEIGKAFSRLGYTFLGRKYLPGKAEYLAMTKTYLWAVRRGENYVAMDPDQIRAAFAAQDINGPRDGAGTPGEQRYTDNVVNGLKKGRPM